jgi:hypothetical protein
VLHALRDVREVDPHEGRDRLHVAEPIPTLPATTAAPISSGWNDPVPGRVFHPLCPGPFTAQCKRLIKTQLSACITPYKTNDHNNSDPTIASSHTLLPRCIASMAQESAAISITIGSKNNTSSGEYIDAHTMSEMKDNAILKKPSSLLPLLLRLRLTQAAPRAFGFLDKGTGFPHNSRRLEVPKTYEALC